MANADLKAAEAGVSQARSGLLPHLNFAEDISRGNDPVYVFGTKLRQQRFTASDFALNSLNRPTPVGNFATRFSGPWMLFNWFRDAGADQGRQVRGGQRGIAWAERRTRELCCR